jgi:3-hydroxyisobutyrate dehydrogenase-like beta-hydroxyacid dehydrogenase
VPENTHPKPDRLAFVGFGEAATAFLSGWGNLRPFSVSAFDIKTGASDTRAEMLDRYLEHNVDGAEDVATALHHADVAFSVVTADQALTAARSASPYLTGGALWLDCNSCAPDTKRAAAELIETAGGRYVDVAIMAPVHPKRHAVPILILISGPHAAAACETLLALDMCPEIAGETVGEASAIKMIRSVMVKGLEALTAECLLAARKAGVEDRVLASLQASDPDIDWRSRATYNLERMMVHGARRAAEMREVAATIAALGVPNRMSTATAEWQDEIARQGADAVEEELTSRLGRILATL